MLPQDKGSEKAVKTLRDLIAAGLVEVRAYLRSPLHAKAYLCWYEGHAETGAAVVGSSNMTLAGFSGNTELNVRVTGDAEMEALRDWFENLWEDSEDIADALVNELDASWPIAQTPPYLVYLKALYELYYSDVTTTPLPLEPRRGQLANFQLVAVRQALAMVEAYGGCYIGDVVGLGKTYIGAELLRQMRQSYPHDGNPLILCPAGLIPMWTRMNEEYDLGAEIVSHSMITSPPDPEFDEEIGRYIDTGAPQQGKVLSQEYPNRGPVLIDEAHNFRNINMRSKGLRDYLESGDHKVVLMSATPQNLGPMDIYRQLTLFLDDMNHGLNIEPLSLEQYFHNAQRQLAYRIDLENYQAALAAWERNRRRGEEPRKPVKPQEPRADIQEVLTPVFIRRRRRDIREIYGDSAEINGKPVRFPDPVLGNVEYRLDKVYAKAGSLKEIEELLKAHKAYRYQASQYVKDELKGREEYRDLFRAGDRIAGLMKALLFKRLESSIEAFRSTLNSLIRSNRNFRSALEAGFVPIGNTATRMLSGQSFEADDLLVVLQVEEQRRQAANQSRSTLVHDVRDFNAEEWMRDLDGDHSILSEILDRVLDIGPEDDDKLRVLREFLDQPEVEAGKVLIFSEAETTIEYLYRQLNPDGADPTIVRLTGSTGSDAQNIVRRFSPGSNPARMVHCRALRSAFCSRLTWCRKARISKIALASSTMTSTGIPVKLIQRFGRVDRIGTEHQVINLHNMWPDEEVDEELDLTDRLLRRVQSFHDLIGLDSKLLHESERLNYEAIYGIYGVQQLPELDDGLDEVAANQRAATLLQRIQDEDPDLWRKITALPDGIRSALTVGNPSEDATPDRYVQGPMDIEGMHLPLIGTTADAAAGSPFDDPRPGETIVLLSSAGVRGCYAVDDYLMPRSISPAQFISAAECRPDTPAEPLPAQTNERVMAAFNSFRGDFGQRLGRARRPRDTRVRRYLSRQLSALASEATNDQQRIAQIDILRQIFVANTTPQVESALSDIRTLGLQGEPLLVRLQALRERYRLNPPDDEDESTPAEMQVIRIVCSDGLI